MADGASGEPSDWRVSLREVAKEYNFSYFEKHSLYRFNNSRTRFNLDFSIHVNLLAHSRPMSENNRYVYMKTS